MTHPSHASLAPCPRRDRPRLGHIQHLAAPSGGGHQRHLAVPCAGRCLSPATAPSTGGHGPLQPSTWKFGLLRSPVGRAWPGSLCGPGATSRPNYLPGAPARRASCWLGQPSAPFAQVCGPVAFVGQMRPAASPCDHVRAWPSRGIPSATTSSRHPAFGATARSRPDSCGTDPDFAAIAGWALPWGPQATHVPHLHVGGASISVAPPCPPAPKEGHCDRP